MDEIDFEPENFNEIYNSNKIGNILEKCYNNRNIPHFLFYGSSGTGKTSSVNLFLKKLYGSIDNSSILYFKGSDDRGINVVRDKIKTFSKLNNNNNIRIVVLDEADNMTNEAQSALRRIMEIYSKNTRFIIICNFLNKIIEPIISRCVKIKFNALSHKNTKKIVKKISKKMDFKFDKYIVDYIINESDGNIKKVINLIKCLHMILKNNQDLEKKQIITILNNLTGNIDDETLDDYMDKLKNIEIEKINVFINDFINNSYNLNKIIKKLINKIYKSEINIELKNEIIIKFHGYLKQIYEGSPEELIIRNVFLLYKIHDL